MSTPGHSEDEARTAQAEGVSAGRKAPPTVLHRRVGHSAVIAIIALLAGLALGVWLGRSDPPPATGVSDAGNAEAGVRAMRAASSPPPPAASSDALGLPPLVLPADVDPSPARVALGRKLFFDRRLSFNGTMSCAMCHVPEEGFTSQASRRAVGIEGRSLPRNAPTLLNVAWQTALFHDGRERSLVTQAWMPILHPDEMANPSPGAVLQRLRDLPDYRGRFESAFGGRGATLDTVGEALAAYQSTLVAAGSRVDRWLYAGDKRALNEIEQAGLRLFTGAARCVACHTVGERDALFSDGRFHVTGAGAAAQAEVDVVVPLAPGVHTVLTPRDRASYSAPEPADLGRFEITLDEADKFAFKTPSLRNVSRTAPYMHDGSLPTLEAVVSFYEGGGVDVPGRSALLAPLRLTSEDRRALVAFLKALDGAGLDRRLATARPHDAPPQQGGESSEATASTGR